MVQLHVGPTAARRPNSCTLVGLCCSICLANRLWHTPWSAKLSNEYWALNHNCLWQKAYPRHSWFHLLQKHKTCELCYWDTLFLHIFSVTSQQFHMLQKQNDPSSILVAPQGGLVWCMGLPAGLMCCLMAPQCSAGCPQHLGSPQPTGTLLSVICTTTLMPASHKMQKYWLMA